MESLREQLNLRHSELKTEVSSWTPGWREISDNLLPRESRFLTTDRNKGNKTNSKIYTGTATRSARILGSGMKAGLTSEHNPWLQLQTDSPDFNNYRPMKVWLDQVKEVVSQVLIGSNIYSVLPGTYRGAGGFGTAAFFLEEDQRDIIRGYLMPIGSYVLANGADGRVDTCFRSFSMTARQMIARYGKEQCSTTVQSLADRKGGESWVPVVHAVQPNPDHDPNRFQSRFKPFISATFEEGANDDRMLNVSGYNEFPVMVARWDVNGEDVYGTGPGHDAIGDIKQLQTMTLRKGQLVDKLNNPPMNAPGTMRNKELGVLPGYINFHDGAMGDQSFRPAYQVDPHLADLRADINEIKGQVREHFHEDLFLLISNDDRSTPATAYEIMARKEEKIQVLGPTLTRFSDELLDPMVARVFAILDRRGMLPPVPQEFYQEGLKLTVEYISVLVQALRMSGFSSLKMGLELAGSMAGLWPEVLDNVDPDETFVQGWGMLGANPKCVRDPKIRDQIRDGRAQQAQQAQALQMAQAGATTAKTLSDTNTQDQNALTGMLMNLRGA